MHPRIIVNKHTPYAEQLFRSIGEVKALASSEVSKESIRDADVLVIRSETKVTRELLEGSRVRFVGTVTIGTDHIDLNVLRQQGITCASAPGSNSNSVAEYILAALLVLSNKKQYSLKEKTLGVVGAGNIGSKVVRIASALGMKVLQYDPPLARTTNRKQFVSFDELLTADIITLHVPFTKTGSDPTYHLFNEQIVSMMKPGAVLINTSRGGVVESQALNNALERGHLSEAILDVWEHEPAINVDLLSNVMIGTPHIAGYSLDGKLNAVQMVYEETCKFLTVKPSVHVRDLLPKSEVEEIRIRDVVINEGELLGDIIKQAYDIEYDDEMLRKISGVPRQERSKYFSTLRAMYRERKEFNHYRVVLPEVKGDVTRFLQSVQFNVKETT